MAALEPEIRIPLSDGNYLVAWRNTAQDYNKEIFIGIEHNGVWAQDLAVVRPRYTYDSEDGSVIFKDDLFDVFVYSDCDQEDYTDEFAIGMYQWDDGEEDVYDSK